MLSFGTAFQKWLAVAASMKVLHELLANDPRIVYTGLMLSHYFAQQHNCGLQEMSHPEGWELETAGSTHMQIDFIVQINYSENDKISVPSPHYVIVLVWSKTEINVSLCNKEHCWQSHLMFNSNKSPVLHTHMWGFD